MPSIFTRARTTSTKNLPKPPLASNAPALPSDGAAGAFIDEFGRVSSRSGGGAPPTPSKDHDRRAQTTADKRRATNTSAASLAELEQEPEFEDGFLPTSLAPLAPPEERQEYGCLSHEAHVILSVEDTQRLVEIVTGELSQRGLTTPFLFSNTALDLSSNSVRRLIDAFLHAPDFADEAKFAGPHALGALLRWGLSRPVRVVSGVGQRGLIPWETYLYWRRVEHANNFNKSEFSSFVGLLAPPLRSLILTLHSFLARLLANSTSSGLTPPKIASLFGPLLFGLATTNFHETYSAYLHAAHAGEHILLAYVRFQVAQTAPSAPPPRRLLSWVQGYPATLAPFDSFERPRHGAKTRRVASVRRNVRMYTADLVRTCAGWARGPEGVGMRSTKEWNRIAPEKNKSGDRMEPRYSDAFRKKLDLLPGVHPNTSSVVSSVASSSFSTPSLSTASSTASTKSSLFEDPAEEARFRSLTDMKWGEFSFFGFGEGDAAPAALQFDLNESARNQRSAKRATLSWADFSAAGFSRSDSTLTQTLQFAQPLAQTIQHWPAQEKDIHRKLKKNVQKALPAFGWDTAPVLDGREVVVEEGFLDLFCDLLYGGGWMDRAETTFRECNWALVEFRSLPTSRAEAAAASAAPSLSLSTSTDPNTPQDPRASTTLLLFEEFVPDEYRAALISQNPKSGRRIPGLAALLSTSKKTQKQWRPAPTLNGRPYVIGSVPRGPSTREAEFERILAGSSVPTKVLTLDATASPGGERLRVQTPVQNDSLSKQSFPSPLYPAGASSSNLPASPAATSPTQPPPLPSKSAESPILARTTSPFSTASIRKARFRFPVGREARQGIIPSEYDTIDFDTRLASYSDEELNNSNRSSGEGANGGKASGSSGAGANSKAAMRERRMSKDDAWVDILVASGGKRISDQDAELRPRASATKISSMGADTVVGKQSPGGDPEFASKEVAQALAAVSRHVPIDDEGDGASEWAIREELSRQVEPREPMHMLQHEFENGNGNGHKYEKSHSSKEEEETSLGPVKRRLGYFDLHPDRRPIDMSSSTVNVQDNKARPDVSVSSASAYENSMYSDGDFEPTSIDGERQADGDIEVPAFIESELSPTYHTYDHARIESITLPPNLNIGSPPQASKTAQLIEMYRERERSAEVPDPSVRDRDITPNPSVVSSTPPLQFPPKISRLPVRTSSHSKESELAVPTPAVPHGYMPELEPGSGFEPEDIGGDQLDQTPVPFVVGELGRVSPMRYVHGAPLHNVLEEGEEEDD
ncbi:hypothetical protein M0805_003998 [Coniferiporia weirii]|nr:hypothetical protein M0805_003998 [Coniferiporia weirii]